MPSAIDYRAVFEDLPSPFMILDRDLNYVAANAAYLAATGRSWQEIEGRNLFDAFPAEGEPRRLLEESLLRALRERTPDHLPLIHYAIPDGAGGFVDRYWSATHKPIIGPDGRADYVVQHTQDVTEVHQLRAAQSASRETPLDAEVWRRAELVQATNAALIAERSRLREFFRQAPGFMAVLSGPSHVFELVNDAYLQLIGHRDVLGKTIVEALPEVEGQGFVALLDQVLTTGQAFSGRNVAVELQTRQGGALSTRYLDFIYQPITGEDGKPNGIFVEGYDVTERLRAEEQERLLMNELNHRVKNTLATVQAIASQTLRHGPDPAAFAETFQARIAALSQTHNVLTEGQWQGADLRPLLEQELAPYGKDHVRMTGGEVRLSPRTAVALGLVLHELTTNAAKYGALSSPGGLVEVSWDHREGRLRIVWREAGGPPVAPPTRRGFGSRLIERSVRGELDGVLTTDYREEGLYVEIDIPLTTALT